MLDLRSADQQRNRVRLMQQGAGVNRQPPICGMPTPNGGTFGKPRGHHGKCG